MSPPVEERVLVLNMAEELLEESPTVDQPEKVIAEALSIAPAVVKIHLQALARTGKVTYLDDPKEGPSALMRTEFSASKLDAFGRTTVDANAKPPASRKAGHPAHECDYLELHRKYELNRRELELKLKANVELARNLRLAQEELVRQQGKLETATNRERKTREAEAASKGRESTLQNDLRLARQRIADLEALETEAAKVPGLEQQLAELQTIPAGVMAEIQLVTAPQTQGDA